MPLDDLTIRIAAPLLREVRARHGDSALAALAATSGIDLEALRAEDAPVTAVDLERLVAAATELLGQERIAEELAGFTHRQAEWIQRLAPEASPDKGGVDHVVRGIEAERERWIRVLRRFTHDVRTPLSVVKTNSGFLRESGAVTDDEGTEVLDDVDAGVERMVTLLDELSASASLDMARVRLEPKPIRVPALAQSIALRVAALVRGRPVHVAVTSTPAAPTSVECDPLLLDRVLDQLLGTAAKHTERGQIAVELDGTDEHLCVEIADTSAGIDAMELAKDLDPSNLRRSSAAGSGWGVGLAVVVQLLARVGGRLEVASGVGVGTTLRAHIPLRSMAPIEPPGGGSKLSEVVSVRALGR